MSWYATHLIAFWDGASAGTAGMIDLARRDGLKLWVRPYGGYQPPPANA